MYVCRYMSVCMHTCSYGCGCISEGVFVCVFMLVCVCMFVYVGGCGLVSEPLYLCIHVSMCLYV